MIKGHSNIFTNSNFLIDFRLIVDIEYGLLQFVKDEMSTNPYFNMESFDYYTENAILGWLFRRETYDSILDFVTNSEIKLSPEIQQSIFKSNYMDILARSPFTDILSFIMTGMMMKDTNFTILCRFEDEKRILKAIEEINEGLCFFVVSENFDDLNLAMYDTIMLSDYRDVIKLAPKMYSKTVVLQNCRYNMDVVIDNDIPKHALKKELEDIIEPNMLSIHLVDKYNMDESYFTI